MRTQKKTARWNDPEIFYVARRRAGLTQAKAADMLQVTTRTLRNWENGSSKIPYAAFRLMRLFGGHSLVGKTWEGWSLWRGALWTPEGRGFEPHELRYVANYLWMARQWLAERRTDKPQNHLGLNIPTGRASAATAARGAPPCQNLLGLAGDIACQQEKPAVWSGLSNSPKFGTIDGLGKIPANDDTELEVN